MEHLDDRDLGRSVKVPVLPWWLTPELEEPICLIK
jgi:hypothetical protein